jgi:hypothetical protein
MFRVYFSLLSLAALLHLASAAPIPPDRKNSVPKYPTAVGTKWVYTEVKRDITRVITDSKVNDDEVTIFISQVLKNGQQAQHMELFISPKGIFIQEIAGMRVQPPLCCFKSQTPPGSSWKNEVKSEDGGTGEDTVTMLEPEEVEVPAGKFKAYRVEHKCPFVSGMTATSTFWFVSGIGIVKEVHNADKPLLKVEMVLKSFTPGKE